MEIVTVEHCEYSEPLDYQGNPPTTDLTSFQFKYSDCIKVATTSGDLGATSSATVSATITGFAGSAGIALHDATYVVWMGFITLAVAFGISLALQYFGRART